MKIVKPKNVKNILYHFIGEIFIILNYIRNGLIGYKTPRTFPINQIDRAIDYDFRVVKGWIKYLCNYTKETNPLKDKIVLELGPGQDLGIGLILLAMGVKVYIALDVFNLAKSTPLEFYKVLVDRLNNKYPDCNINFIKEQKDKCYKGENDKIKYIVDKNFDISKIEDKVDIVFSQATFEHFENVEKTFKELSNIIKEDGVLVTEIDLKTHTRWIRDRDPLNIYRYSEFFYNMFKFKGSPNRIRIFEYSELLAKNGFSNVQIDPLSVLEDEYLDKVKQSLNKKFSELDNSEIKVLGIMLMAKKD